MNKTSGELTVELEKTRMGYAADVKRLLRQQAALATFGTFAFRETELLEDFERGRANLREVSECSVLQDLALPLEGE